MIDVRIQAADFDPGAQLERLGTLRAAAVSSFTGILTGDDAVKKIVIEHYATLAKAELTRMAEEAEARWPLAGIILIHRHGILKPQSRVLFVGAAGADSGAAVDACGFIVAALRDRGPFWRKDVLAGGVSSWR